MSTILIYVPRSTLLLWYQIYLPRNREKWENAKAYE